MKFFTRLILCLMISFTLTELPVMKAKAEMISTTTVMAEMTRAEADSTVHDFIARGDVKDQLVKLGISSEEASRRLASLSDSEVRKLAKDMKSATIGGDVTGILVLVLLVVAIIYLAKRI